ncbi:serine hydrolase domain-containing protein [Streptomyces sp. NPDC006365]|uniref:serine hydrolase domain-containing protein n=1 Tax=Streptomyces sp. NPDC006365 TaxID=3364744 RepID=UPI00367A3BDC
MITHGRRRLHAAELALSTSPVSTGHPRPPARRRRCGRAGRRDGATATAGPVTADAHARIGSVTKAFTNTVVLQLVAEHRIGLDTPARRYIPQVLPKAYHRVTVHQLLDHTSGLPRPPPPPARPTDPDGSSNP